MPAEPTSFVTDPGGMGLHVRAQIVPPGAGPDLPPALPLEPGDPPAPGPDLPPLPPDPGVPVPGPDLPPGR